MNMQHAFKRDAPELFISKPASNVFLMENTGLALMYASKEKLRNPVNVSIYIAEEMLSLEIPEQIRKSSEWKIANKFSKYPRSKKTLKENELLSREDLRETIIRAKVLIYWLPEIEKTIRQE